MIYPFNYRGVHHCEAAIVACIDFRFWRQTLTFVEQELGIRDFDFPKLPGSAKAINECAEDDTVSKCVSVPCELHRAKKLVIINHEDCGAYGGSGKFPDGESEQCFHEEELRKARTKVLATHPELEIILVYARLVDDSHAVEFVKVE